jgi:hypothetical protein
MRKLILAVLISFAAVNSVSAQGRERVRVSLPTVPSNNITGTGAASRCALFNGTLTLTSDSGCTYSGSASTFQLKPNSLGIVGTGGAGFINFVPQSSDPATPASGFNLFADSAGKFGWKGTNGFKRIFDGTANTADQAYVLPNASGNLSIEQSMPMGTGGLTGSTWRTINTCVYANSSNIQTLSTIEEVLFTCTIPVNTLPTNGSAIRIRAFIATAANTNSKVARLRLGGLTGTQLVVLSTTTSAASFRLEALILRGSATSGIVDGSGMVSATPAAVTITPISNTWANAIDLVVTGTTGTAIADETLKGVFTEGMVAP